MELTPDFSISINGTEVFIKERVISIRTADEAGIVSDSCEIELDNYDNALACPNTEAKIVLSLGYKEIGLTQIGTYFVKEITIDGARRTIKIQGNAASKAMRSQKTKNNSDHISDLALEMANNFDLEAAISDGADVDFSDTVQFAESDMSLLTRMSQKFGAVAKPVDGHLVLNSEMSGKSVSGKNLPLKYIDASDVASYSCSFKETESGGGSGTVYANWYDENTGEYHLEHAGEGEPETELQEIFASKEQALAAARAKFARVTKNNRTFNFSIAGRTDLFAESPLEIKGFPQAVPTRWIISRVEHNLNNGGFHTSVNCNCLN